VAALLFADTAGNAFNSGNGLFARGESGLLAAGTGPVPNSPTGGNFVAFDGAPSFNASISQVISGLTVGSQYDLAFWQGAAQQRGLTGATTEWWRVTFGDETQDSHVMNNASHGWVPWEYQSMRFTATSPTQTLTFLALGTPNGLPPVVLLDGLSLTETPEPQTVALVGFSLVCMSLLRRRRR